MGSEIIPTSQGLSVCVSIAVDVVSNANLRLFGEAVDRLGKQTDLTIGRVNCYDWTDVCQKEHIIIYPTLRVYKNGEFAFDYSGPQEIQAMYSTLRL